VRTRARVDTNQSAIVEALRGAGATVLHLHTIGKGCPDIAVGIHGRNYLLEIKNGSKSPSKRKLTPDEQKWHEAWRGEVCIVSSEAEALAAIGAKGEVI
jgi:hypothetical protein